MRVLTSSVDKSTDGGSLSRGYLEGGVQLDDLGVLPLKGMHALSVCGDGWVHMYMCTYVRGHNTYVRGWRHLSFTVTLLGFNFLLIETFHPGEKFPKTQKVLEGDSL